MEVLINKKVQADKQGRAINMADDVKSKVIYYLKLRELGASVSELVESGVCSYEDGCNALTELELDGKIRQVTSPLWEIV